MLNGPYWNENPSASRNLNFGLWNCIVFGTFTIQKWNRRIFSKSFFEKEDKVWIIFSAIEQPMKSWINVYHQQQRSRTSSLWESRSLWSHIYIESVAPLNEVFPEYLGSRPAHRSKNSKLQMWFQNQRWRIEMCLQQYRSH